MKDQRANAPAGIMRSAGIRRASLAAAAIFALVGFGLTGCGVKGPGTAKTTDELLAQLKEDRTRIDQNTDLMMQRIDQFNASRKPGEKTLQFGEIFSQDLSPEQRDVLNQMVAQEKDVSYKALLQKIISDRDTIQGLQENVMHLEQTLPDKFVVAKRGDKQHNLALAYLTDEAHVEPAKAKELLNQVDQTDELLPGNKVWFFYDPKQDVFRTYVTQGEAGKTPLAVRRAKQRQLIQERDTFKSERDTAQTEVTSLQQTKSDLETDIAGLTQRKTELEGTVDQLSRDIALRENSVYYHAANERTLRDEGVLSSVLKKVRDVKGLHYDESLDLRQGTTITLLPGTYGLTEIREVRLLPPIYQEGRDFTIQTSQDHSSAQLVILDPELFRGKEILLSIRG
jgi:hypothetical protein